MGPLSKEKRKNDAPRRFQWWLLLIGFVLGVVATVIALQGREQPATNIPAFADEELYLTATSIIVGATGTAQAESSGAPNSITPIVIDPLAATATVLVEQATQQVATPTP